MKRRHGFKRQSLKKRFKIRKKKPFFKKKNFWLSSLFLSLLGAIFYFFIFFDFFQIKEIRISGNKKVSQESLFPIIESGMRKKLFFSTKTIFLVDAGFIEKTILKEFPQVNQAKLKRDFPNTLILEIEERTVFAVLCQDLENCFLTDKRGIAFEQGRGESKFLIFLEKKENIELGHLAISENYLQSIFEIVKDLKEKLKMEIQRISLAEEKLTVETAQGFEIYFNLDDDISEQIFNLEVLSREKILPEDWQNIEYIDLRFGNKVFYK